MIISPASLLANTNFIKAGNPRDILCMPVVKIICRLKPDKIIYPVTVCQRRFSDAST